MSDQHTTLLIENYRTEEQARQAFCVKRLWEETPDPVVAHCLGARCMAWRWYDAVRDEASPPPPRRGFCGLAGRP